MIIDWNTTNITKRKKSELRIFEKEKSINYCENQFLHLPNIGKRQICLCRQNVKMFCRHIIFLLIKSLIK
jgi:hypothetical protein